MTWITPEGARPCDDIILDELPRGVIHRRYVRLIDDGIGMSMRVPVLIARGLKEGPVLGVTAALHGNELNGIPLIHRLFQGLDCQKLKGTVIAVVVANLPGYLMHQRFFNDGEDLNRVFPGREAGNMSQAYAYALLNRIVNRFEYFIDLHTASFGRINSLYIRANLQHPVVAEMANLIQPQIILHNPAPERTLRGQAMSLGIPALTLEIGNPHRIQRDLVRAAQMGIRNVMRYLKMIKGPLSTKPERSLYCQRSYWIYTEEGGMLETLPAVTEIVEKGQVIARMRNIFGDIIREYLAPESGVVIGRSADPVAQTGARIVHLGILGIVPSLEEKNHG